MPAKAGIQNYLKTLDSRLRGHDVYGIYLILIGLLSFPRRRESRKWENSTFYETINIRRSMFDVQSFHCYRAGEVSYKRRRWLEKRPV